MSSLREGLNENKIKKKNVVATFAYVFLTYIHIISGEKNLKKKATDKQTTSDKQQQQQNIVSEK